jgi:hypothetical protein
VVAPHETPIKKGEAGGHEVDLCGGHVSGSSYEDAGSTHQRAGHEDPGRVARVDACVEIEFQAPHAIFMILAP